VSSYGKATLKIRVRNICSWVSAKPLMNGDIGRNSDRSVQIAGYKTVI
jgi:hypothetical protein